MKPTFTLRNEDGSLSLELAYGDGSPTVTDGYGGWITIDRYRRRPITEWQGPGPLRIQIPVAFENWAAGEGVQLEQDIRALEQMAGLDGPVKGHHGLLREPPRLIVDSGGFIPHDFHDASQLRWVIEELQWAEGSLRNKAGNRLRQPATITILNYQADDALESQSATLKRRAGKRKGKTYKTHPGDTLSKVAAKQLGSAKKWRALRKLNPKFRDPGKVLPTHTVLKLP